jgi:hypothetical protein
MRRRLLVMLAIGLVVIACDSPSGPPPPPPPPPPPGVKALTINGRARIAPGETEAYEAIAQMTNATTQVLTTEVQWQTSNNSLLSIVATSGAATARAVGDVVITASYRGVRGSSSVIVVPTGTYRLTGKVLESGLPVQGALVKITSRGPGLSRSTGFAGDYSSTAWPDLWTSRSRAWLHDDHTIDRCQPRRFGRLRRFRAGRGRRLARWSDTLTITVASDCRPSPRRRFRAENARMRRL